MQKKVMALCLWVQFFLAIPVYLKHSVVAFIRKEYTIFSVVC